MDVQGIETAMRVALAAVDAALAVAPAWLEPWLVVGLFVALALLLHAVAWRLARRAARRASPGAGRIADRARRPTRLFAVFLAFAVVVEVSALPPTWRDGLSQVAVAILLVIVGWAAIVAVDELAERSVRRYSLHDEDNLAARKYVTQVRVLRRTAKIVLVLLTVAAVLSTFEEVRRLGVSLFASAGVAGIAVGFAARPVLANLIAGVQIALTQPIRLEDVVIVEGEWGQVEEIGATYVVVRVWDLRRLVVPLSYFIEQPFQNWTRGERADHRAGRLASGLRRAGGRDPRAVRGGGARLCPLGRGRAGAAGGGGRPRRDPAARDHERAERVAGLGPALRGAGGGGGLAPGGAPRGAAPPARGSWR